MTQHPHGQSRSESLGRFAIRSAISYVLLNASKHQIDIPKGE